MLLSALFDLNRPVPISRRSRTGRAPRALAIAAFSLLVAACGGGGGGDSGGATGGTSGGGNNGTPPPATPAPVSQQALEESASFLSKATFGASYTEIEDLAYSNQSLWFRDQLARPPTLHLDAMQARVFEPEYLIYRATADSFWESAINGDDQLRQRMAFALSQIFVVSTENDTLVGRPNTMAHYMDILTENAFGNFRDLLHDVTYSPAMASYLTYLYNERGDPMSGRVPDENYAREIMQLFTIGLVQLQMDGSPVLDNEGQPIETYDNDDVTGLARVFTGLGLAGPGWWDPSSDASQWEALQMFEAFHSPEEKRFLGTVIPAGTDGSSSIDMALDALFEHPNVAPFFSRQLIQRFTLSNPSNAYIGRVANTFETGSYRLPDGSTVGEGIRGDLAATLAAVLMDSEANIAPEQQSATYGKVREPVIRFVHWARAFGIDGSQASREDALWNTSAPGALAQQPYGSRSVFNFYRPGYVAPGTASGDAGMTAPELQIINEASIIGYANFLSPFIIGESWGDRRTDTLGFHPDYSAEIEIADDVDALIDRLDLMLTSGQLEDSTRDVLSLILQAIPIIPGEETASRRARVQTALLVILTSYEFAIQR